MAEPLISDIQLPPIPKEFTGITRQYFIDLTDAMADASIRGSEVFVESIKNVEPWIDVRSYGAVGDGVTDDTDAINLAIAACSAGDTLYFPSGYTFKITDGIVISMGIIVWGYGATLYMEGTCTTAYTIPTLSGPPANYNSMILVWCGDEAQNVMNWSTGEPVIEDDALIENFHIYGLTFKKNGGLGSAYVGALGCGLTIYGVDGGIVKDCHFEDFDAEVLHCAAKNLLITDNTFENVEGDCIAAHLNNCMISNNKFVDCDYAIECCPYNSVIANNYIRAENYCSIGIWVANGGNSITVNCNIMNNVIDGYFGTKIQVTDSGSDPTDFKRVNISGNICVGRFGSGSYGVYIEAADAVYTIADNYFDDRGTTVNAPPFIYVTGTDTDGKYIIKNNRCHITTSYPYAFIQMANIDIAQVITGNDSYHDSGCSFRETNMSAAYKGAIRIGTFKSNLKIIENNCINGTSRYVDTGAGTQLLIGGDTELYFNTSAKSVTDIYANGFFTVHNLGAANITLTDNDAKIETTGDADIVLAQYDSAGFIAVGTTGKVKQVF